MKEVVLILGGTREAAQLAAQLKDEKPDARIISSLAGRTKEPKPLVEEVRIGGFGGVDGLVSFIQDNDVTRLIDATHPFAKQISKNAILAAQETQIDFEIVQRPAWKELPGDLWIRVDNLEAAHEAIPPKARVLLALGSQHIGLFASRNDVHFLIRMVDEPQGELHFEDYAIEIGKPGDVAHETRLLERHKISHIVCRNSGGEGAYAKIEAARALGVPVIIVGNS